MPFTREPSGDPWDLRESYAHPDQGPHRFFRHVHGDMQRRFTELTDADSMPAVFLHGNPHLANYAKTSRGAAMVDFDRARFGPYAYDLVRFLISVSLRRADDGDGRLAHGAVTDSLRRGYLLGLNAPKLPVEQMHALKKREPKGWQRDLVRYLEKGKAWGARLKKHRVDPQDPRLHAMWETYLISRGEEELTDRYSLIDAAMVAGSLGKTHTLLLLESAEDTLDTLLLDVKEVYDEPDEGPFWNPYSHNGQRMVVAGELHAPGWERKPGWATVDGVQYWVREIPIQNEKLRRRISPIEQIDLCFAVGTQLGRAHGLSVLDARPDVLVDAIMEEYAELLDVALTMRRELTVAHRAYVDASLVGQRSSVRSAEAR
ncbi:MAG: DUF2252 family protein [Sandaracinaceae bacterium]